MLLRKGTLLLLMIFLYKVGSYPRANLDYNVIFNALRHVNLLENGEDMFACVERAREITSWNNKMIRLLVREDDNSLALGHQMWNRKLGEDILIKYKLSMSSTKEV